jgi:hypothetical protein
MSDFSTPSRALLSLSGPLSGNGSDGVRLFGHNSWFIRRQRAMGCSDQLGEQHVEGLAQIRLRIPWVVAFRCQRDEAPV